MKICVYGAGAIGGYMGAKLAQSGQEVTLIARGPHLEAMRKNGLTLKSEGETINVRPRATQDSREAGTQDYVILSVKAHSSLVQEATCKVQTSSPPDLLYPLPAVPFMQTPPA